MTCVTDKNSYINYNVDFVLSTDPISLSLSSHTYIYIYKTSLAYPSLVLPSKHKKSMAKSFVLAMVSCLVLAVAFAAATDMSIIDYDLKHGQRTNTHVRSLYEAWLVNHGKAYNALGEKERRFEIFKDNLRFIDEHNKVENRTYRLGLNRFADLTNDEYRSMFLGGRMDRKGRLSGTKSGRYAYRAGEDLPESVDWREKGAVVEVKDQGQCGKFLFCLISFPLLLGFCLIYLF